MLLTEVFTPELIKCDLKGGTKYAIFEEMVDLFCQVTQKNVKQDILDALREREARMSTGVQHGVAIPHGKTAAIDRIFGVMGVSKGGVDYDAMDGKPVYLILMIIAPPVAAEIHLQMLQRMANFLHSPSFYTDIITAKDSDAAYAVIKKYENRLPAEG
ncbi:MAG: PTS sugar transporter subunit IIA [Spirochaetaceae bacterium]|jgi:PTS system fructose-specific IIC component/PTS system nitrogen regulatory IIA component|nr:PTS sugar transporter subunit IIA [Spirochaetaceae bacterium]